MIKMKKKMNHKYISMAGAAAMALMLGACGTTGRAAKGGQQPTAATPSAVSQSSPSASTSPAASTSDTGKQSDYNDLGTFPIVKQKQQITVMRATQSVNFNPDTNWMTSYYEDKTNVSVKWHIAPLEQFKEKVTLAFASSEKLDLIICGGYSQTAYSMTDVLKFAEQGVILPLQDLIESDSIYFKQRLDEVEGWRELITLPNGGIYSLPTLNECFHCMYYGKMWVNQEFLKNVDMKNPTTTEEFHAMLKAFKEMDANGNGDLNDEIPMMGAIDNYGARVDTFLMSAFIFDDGENRLFLDNGKVTAVFAQPEFREGLRYLNTLFSEGLIHPESFTASREVRNKINSQKYESTIGAIPNIHHAIGSRGSDEPVRWIDYEPIKPLKGPDGLQVTRYAYYEKFQTAMPAGFIPETCKNPALVMRWLDWFMSEEGTVMLLRGEENTGWEKADQGSTGVDGKPAAYKTLVLPETHQYFGNLIWGQSFPNFNTAASRLGMQQPDDMLASDGKDLEKFLYMKSLENYAPYAVAIEQIIPPLYYSSSEVSEIAQLTTTINTYVEESIAKFIIGDKSLDNDWDKFLSELKNIGLERYLQIIQNTYNASAFSR